MRRIQLLGIGALLLLAAGCSTYEPDSILQDTGVKISLEHNSLVPAWESGDRVAAFAMDGTTPVSSYIFTAAGRGSSADFHCPTEVVDASLYRFVYPSDESLAFAKDGIRATIPVVQPPVEGGISPELYFSTAAVSALDQEVKLQPLVALAKFTLLGGAAETVRRVTLTGNTTISGTVTFQDGTSVQSVFFDEPFAYVNPSNYVEMAGKFSSGGTYYVALVPGQGPITLQAVIEDNQGKVRTIEVDNVSLSSGEITDLGTFYLGHTMQRDEGDLIPIMKATKGTKPIILMFVPDGWVEGTGAGTKEEYVKACREGAAYLFNVEPFKSQRDYFTVYIAWKAASEAGVGTTFGSELGLWYDNYLSLSTDARRSVCNFAAEVCPEVQSGLTHPKDMGIFLLVNGRQNYGAVCEWSEQDSRYEGRFVAVLDYAGEYIWNDTLGAGVIPAQWGGNTSDGPLEARTDDKGNTYTYTLTESDLRELGYTNYSGSSWGILTTWKNTLLHEGGGHGIGRLLDEYWFSTDPYTNTAIAGQTMKPPRGLNLTANPDKAPWKNLMQLRDELMEKDPRYARISNHQGGYVSYFSGIWRADKVGAMNDMRPYFGTWDRALIYQRIMQMSGTRPDFDVVNNLDDLKAFLEVDLATGGNFDPLRDN